jgi:hypothetical protein
MSYRRKTLRRLKPVTRRYARVINDLEGVLRRLKNLTEEIDRLELDSRALFNRTESERRPTSSEPLFPEEDDDEL